MKGQGLCVSLQFIRTVHHIAAVTYDLERYFDFMCIWAPKHGTVDKCWRLVGFM